MYLKIKFNKFNIINNLKTINTFAFTCDKLKSISIQKCYNIAVTAFNNNLFTHDQAFIYRRNSDDENKIRLIVMEVKKENVVIPNNVIVIENMHLMPQN